MKACLSPSLESTWRHRGITEHLSWLSARDERWPGTSEKSGLSAPIDLGRPEWLSRHISLSSWNAFWSIYRGVRNAESPEIISCLLLSASGVILPACIADDYIRRALMNAELILPSILEMPSLVALLSAQGQSSLVITGAAKYQMAEKAVSSARISRKKYSMHQHWHFALVSAVHDVNQATPMHFGLIMPTNQPRIKQAGDYWASAMFFALIALEMKYNRFSSSPRWSDEGMSDGSGASHGAFGHSRLISGSRRRWRLTIPPI